MMGKRIASAAALAALLALGTPSARAVELVIVCDEAPGCAKKVCVPVTETKKVSKREFGDVCEDFCLPPCSPFACLFGCGCGCHKVRTRKFLVIRNCVREECVTKCVPMAEQCAPACQAPCAPQYCPAQGAPGCAPLPCGSNLPPGIVAPPGSVAIPVRIMNAPQ